MIFSKIITLAPKQFSVYGTKNKDTVAGFMDLCRHTKDI